MVTPYFDVVTFGETMLRLSPPNHQFFEQGNTLDMHVGGSESNVAVGLARLGAKVAWFSALPNHALGHYVTSKIAQQGVDTSQVIWTEEGRLGLYWVEQAVPPRVSKVLYDRSHTAISQISPEQLPVGLFETGRARWLHVSGITPALSPQAAATTRHAVQLAKQAGWQVSFDLNYRAKLWNAEQARAGCSDLMEQANLIFAPYRDLQTVLGWVGDPPSIFSQFRARYPHAMLVMTSGAEGALACLPQGDSVQENAFEPTAIDRIGAGDAFVAGFLSQVIQQATSLDLGTALRWANAAAALKYTIVGDMPLISRADIMNMLTSSSASHIQR